MEMPQMSPDFIPLINPARCIGCELCVRMCPTHALAMIDDVASVANPEACNYSSICQDICPTEAISLLYEIVF
jgi:formate hydrogenlyase subunit 6/NADH:ubiquinone oxidoreductase subunit I